MSKLKPKQKAWLVGAHMLLAGIWVGAGVCLVLLNVANAPARVNSDEVHAMNAVAKLLDDFVIIPAAMGSLLSGLLISWLTHWGFFKFIWVTIKWVLTIASILFGTFFLGPWLNGMEAISAVEHAQALHNATYLHYHHMNAVFGSVQVSSLIFMVFLSTLKPWKKWKRT